MFLQVCEFRPLVKGNEDPKYEGEQRFDNLYHLSPSNAAAEFGRVQSKIKSVDKL